MIFNLIRTILELNNYLDKIQYPRLRITIYISMSVIAGILMSNSSRAADLPILTVTAILFGFTINAVVLLGNSSEHYLTGDRKHGDQLADYYGKSLYISIHTLGIGIVTIIVTGLYQLFPDVHISLIQTQFSGYALRVELISAMVYTLTAYYIVIFSIVIASAAELVKIRV